MRTNSEIHYDIQKVLKLKEEHLKKYSDAIENLAKNKSSMLFVTGDCSECDMYDRQIVALEKELKI